MAIEPPEVLGWVVFVTPPVLVGIPPAAFELPPVEALAPPAAAEPEIPPVFGGTLVVPPVAWTPPVA